MLIPLGLKAVEEELQAEVQKPVGGGRHNRTGGTNKRWDQKLKINVPRVGDFSAREEVPLKSYRRLQDLAKK